jgi:succinoglycan biosynthesis protein ExoA
VIDLSVIIPVRNEGKHLGGVLDRLLAQEKTSPEQRWEILVVDGCSTDNTQAIVQSYCEKFDNVRLLENPKRLSSAARNIGVQNAQGKYVLVVDGHCIIDNDQMLANVIKAFEESGADCLGRPQPLEMENATTMQWAIASARRSPLGHHPDSLIYSGQAQFSPASSVAIAYRKEIFDNIGLFDERFDACEDVELNTRIDKAGLKCFFDPAIAVRYVPRHKLSGLFYQMNRYGKGRVRLFKKHRETFSLKSFGLGFFVLGVLVGLPLCFVHLFLAWFYAAMLALYLLTVCSESLRLAVAQKRFALLPLLPFVFFTIHFGFGWGILREFLKFRNF